MVSKDYSMYKKELVFTRAFDKRDPDPEKNYGIHGMEMIFLLSGKLATVQFVLYTNWQLPHIQQEYADRALNQGVQLSRLLIEPIPADIGYHCRVPMYEGQTPMRRIVKIRKAKPIKFQVKDKEFTLPDIKIEHEMEPTPCPHLNNDPCFYDGSGLSAKAYFEELITNGEEALWEMMIGYYRRNLADESHWLRYFNIFQYHHETTPGDHWFFIYRHQNGGWERSAEFKSPEDAVANKIITHLKVYYKKLSKFILNKLYNSSDVDSLLKK